MSYEKRKTEQYSNFGGINNRWSPHDTGPMEFLDLKNLDFYQPGSLSGRWGSSMYVGQTFPGQINSLFEFTRLDGSSYVINSYSGGAYFGATTGNAQGMSFTLQSVTANYFGNVYYVYMSRPAGSDALSVANSNGAKYLGISTNPYYGYGTNVDTPANGSSFTVDATAIQSDNRIDYAVLNNQMFFADGNKFGRFDGSTTYPVGLPPILSSGPSLTATVDTIGSTRACFPCGDSFGVYYLFGSYVNNRGFEGPIWPLAAINANTARNASLGLFSGNSNVIVATLSIATPLQFGISAINVYSAYDTSVIGQTYNGSALGTVIDNIAYKFWNMSPVKLLTTPASGSTVTTFPLGVSINGIASGLSAIQQNATGAFASDTVRGYFPLGITYSLSSTVLNTIGGIERTNFAPKYIETYQNRLFLAGFSAMLSTVWFSDVAEPEGYQPSWNFEVRTNDGDTITALKTYQSKLYIFKNNSFHVLLGDSPQNFSLQQVSDQYGAVNNRSVVTFSDKNGTDLMAFLDKKGVLIWSGAGVANISAKIENTILRINWTAAKNEACAVHDKIKNQLLFAVPLDSSTVNNILLVYDYNMNAWTTYDNLPVSSFAQIIGRDALGNKRTFYGSYSGSINWFGASFYADNANGFTAYFKSRFLHELGDSTQKMYRRLYINTDSNGTTLSFNLKFYQDYGSSVVLSSSLVFSSFQDRLDFGISAKALAFELANIQTAIPLKIHGFTIESRFLRRV